MAEKGTAGEGSKTLVQQLTEAQNQVLGLTTQLTEAGKQIESGKALVADLTGKLAASEKTLAETVAAHKTALESQAAESGKALETVKGELATVQGELETAKSALANPAFADAALKGSTGTGHEGGTGGAGDGAQMTADEAKTAYTKMQHAEGDPRTLALQMQAFRAAHWKLLGIPEEKVSKK
jgi:uncharacterized coiled-coil protein SlyX